METNIKQGDFVRLTDPISNGQIVRIESVSEYGTASWLGGAQKGDMEQVECFMMAEKDDAIGLDDFQQFNNLSDVCRHIEATTGVKLYPESAVEYWKRRAEIKLNLKMKL